MTQQPRNTVFGALALYSKLYASPITEEELTAGLPMAKGEPDPRMLSAQNQPDNVIRAAARAGLKASLFERRLDELSELVLPAIIIMKDESACLFDGFEGDKAKVMLPEADGAVHEIDKEKLESGYSGFLFLVGKVFTDKSQDSAISQTRGHWFWHTLWISFPIYRDILMASFAVNVFALASPMFTMNVYDRVVPNFAVDTLWVLATGVIVIMVLDGILRFLRTNFIEIAAKKSDIIISSRLFERVLDLRMEQAPRNIGGFANNLREFDSIRNFLTSSVMLFLVDLPFTALFLLVINYIGGNLVVVPIAMMSILLIYTLLIKNPLYQSTIASFQDSAKKNAILVEAIAGLRDIKLLNAAGRFQWTWENIVGSLANKGIKARFLSSSISTITALLVQLNNVLIVAYGVYLIHDGLLSMGGLIAAVILASRTIAPMGQVVALISQYEQTKVAYQSLQKLMKLEVERPDGKEFIRKQSVEGTIEFKNVSFNYPGEEKPAVDGISFKLKTGERIGLIGRTGSGKSTLHKLLLGLFRPQNGRILIDDLDIQEMNPVFLRKNFSCLPQDFSLFSGTIRENITLKNPQASDEELLEAVKLGGLEDFIKSSPKGFDTLVAERGANLSGGQRQGVAVARAFITESPIILLDEPTSFMDGTTEQQVKQNLVQRFADKTVIISTHKNALLELVDRIIIVDNGKIAFDGSKEEFLKTFSQKVSPEKTKQIGGRKK